MKFVVKKDVTSVGGSFKKALAAVVHAATVSTWWDVERLNSWGADALVLTVDGRLATGTFKVPTDGQVGDLATADVRVDVGRISVNIRQPSYGDAETLVTVAAVATVELTFDPPPPPRSTPPVRRLRPPKVG